MTPISDEKPLTKTNNEKLIVDNEVDDPFLAAPFSLPPVLREKTANKKSGGKA